MVAPVMNMLSSLLHPRRMHRRVDQSMFEADPHSQTPSPGPATRDDFPEPRHATADFTEADDDEEESDEDGGEAEHLPRFSRYRGNGGVRPANRRTSSANILLPLFSASYLDSLPVYSIVHSIRIIVQTRTETMLTWDQLRSPQVSQFLIKPMQQQIRSTHYNRATLYALMANCLQFCKEGQLNPANAGTSSTRAKVCELLALKLLKEYNTRELIDALSYDFYPLQGRPGTPGTPNAKNIEGKNRTSAARSSTLEVAILASAKHFLAHPLVVQQLEAIWNGAITFYAAADRLHREPAEAATSVRAVNRVPADSRTPLLGLKPAKHDISRLPIHTIPIRRTVALYDPRNASLFKLSRLRVPRYRHFLSTCSLGILICLFLSVLIQRSSRITPLELVFWFWSAGFMLDELVGFNEQGFSLYIMSFWNIFDLGILLLLTIYYCLRLYGVFLIESSSWNDMAYDVLASNAILLLPRIFSVLDHYPYFSQLLLGFRLMAVDLAAVFVLILISCSGFFVFFTFSHNQNDATDVAYKIFQILMGFTPAAWDVWPQYNFLGRLLMVIFLIICHFVVVTILITVLTNSFMAIASNAKEEHQFLFAINTISMVKNDALFSYIAPGNILAWILMPLRYVMPMKHFVKLNRTVIKLTHFPLLFCIFFYERYFLASSMFEPTDLVENSFPHRGRSIAFADRTALFSPRLRAREQSVAGQQKDRALDEVFRRPPDVSTLRQQWRQERRKSQTAIRHWMDQNDEAGGALAPPNWPTMDSRISRDESQRRLSVNRDLERRPRQFSEAKSANSDPTDLMTNLEGGLDPFSAAPYEAEGAYKDQTDADGDDELVTNDEDDADDEENATESRRVTEDYFTHSKASRFAPPVPSTFSSQGSRRSLMRHMATNSPRSGPSRPHGLHSRTQSTNTILFAPVQEHRSTASPSSIEQPVAARPRPKSSRLNPAVGTPASSGDALSPRRTKESSSSTTRPRPIPAKSLPNRTAASRPNSRRQRLPSMDVEINSELALDPDVHHDVPLASSFATQMALATGQLRTLGHDRQERDSADRLSRLVLARMKTLEEGFENVVREMRVMRSTVPSSAQDSGEEGSSVQRPSTVNTVVSGGSSDKRRSGDKGKKKQQRSRPESIREEQPSMASGSQHRSEGGKGKQVAKSEGGDERASSPHLRGRGSSL